MPEKSVCPYCEFDFGTNQLLRDHFPCPDDTPGRYYDQCDKRCREARAKVREARAEGADMTKIRRLEILADIACNTGD